MPGTRVYRVPANLGISEAGYSRDLGIPCPGKLLDFGTFCAHMTPTMARHRIKAYITFLQRALRGINRGTAGALEEQASSAMFKRHGAATQISDKGRTEHYITEAKFDA